MALYEITSEPLPIDFEGCTTDVLRTLQNAKNLIMCKMGEVPFDRYRGFDPALFDLTPSEFSEALLPELDRVMLWEPEATVVSATFNYDSNQEIIIHCIVDVMEEDEEDEE